MSDYMIEFPEDDVIEVLFNDVIVTGSEPPSGTISITENGDYDVTNYAEASVNVPQGITPTGTISITENGTVDVTTYAEASVNVPQGVFPSGTYNITANGTFDITNYQYVAASMIGKTALFEETIEVTPETDLSVISFTHHLGVIPQYVHIYMADGFDAAPNSTSVEIQTFKINTDLGNIDINANIRKSSSGARSTDLSNHVITLNENTISANWITGSAYYRSGYKYICKCFGNIIIGSETDVTP